MEIAEHIEVLRWQGTALADAADGAGLDSLVPPCAPWLVKDLLRHTGFIHRWAASHIVSPAEQVREGPSEEEILQGGAPDGELVDWFRDGHATLVRVLEAADPALRTAAFMPASSPLAFWARRQAHETAIHRADAESATGELPGFSAEFAADGVDELIMGFGRRRKYRPGSGPGGTLRVLAADTGDTWQSCLTEGQIQSGREPAGPAGCVVSGPASGVYLFLWNRAEAERADVTVSGDRAVLEQWKRGVRVRRA